MNMIGRRFRWKQDGDIFVIYCETPPNSMWAYAAMSERGGRGHDCDGLLPKGKKGWLVDVSGRGAYNINNEEYWEEIIEDFWRL
ncbi:MAG: hypothetical protein ACRCX2_12315 [Paraclostridium sp.]